MRGTQQPTIPEAKACVAEVDVDTEDYPVPLGSTERRRRNEKLLVSVAWLALGEDRTGGDVERRESSGRAVVDIVVRHAFDIAQSHG